MLGGVLQPGDEVILTIPQENREWGYNPFPDGTKAKFVRFSEMDYGWANQFGREPGIYENDSWAYFQLENGKQVCEYCGRAEMVDKEECLRRDAAMRDHRGHFIHNGKKLRDLPETRFIEGDVVTSPSLLEHCSGFQDGEAIIAQVNYKDIGKFCTDGVTPIGLYSISPEPRSWTQHVPHRDEVQLTLVHRGNVWKYRHGEDIVWKDDEEQAEFYNQLGLTTEIRNPSTDMYLWTKEEAVQALKDGIGDCICVGNGFFGSGPHTSVKRFNDRELGERIRKQTLVGFEVTA
jgi:hypothetical protein